MRTPEQNRQYVNTYYQKVKDNPEFKAKRKARLKNEIETLHYTYVRRLISNRGFKQISKQDIIDKRNEIIQLRAIRDEKIQK